MSLDEEKLNQNEWVRWLLNEDHKAELWKILAFWEKYKKEWKMLEQKFWIHWKRRDYKDLLRYYEKNKENFEWLLPEEKDMLDSLDGVAREKFYKEYLFNMIFYGWKSENRIRRKKIVYNWAGHGVEWFRAWVVNKKDGLKPWMEIDLGSNGIWEWWMEILWKEWKDSLKPGMEIKLCANMIRAKWVEILAREWKDSLKPGMTIDLSQNDIWDEWLEALAKEWKNKLQPGMKINLWFNGIWDEWVKILAKEWKNKLQPGMEINLQHNDIWDEWLEILAREWKDSLKPWMAIYFVKNNISINWIEVLAKEWKNKLQPGMEMMLDHNDIWDEWLEILAREWKDSLKPGMYINVNFRNIEVLAEEWKNSLQPGMTISFRFDLIWDEWADYIMKNRELKEWMKIYLEYNEISLRKKIELKKRVKWYKNRWINCEVKL